MIRQFKYSKGLLLILLFLSACSSAESIQDSAQDNMGSAEIRTTIEAYDKAQKAGLDFKASEIYGDENNIEIRDGYVFIGRKDNLSVGLHNLQYSLFAEDTVMTKSIPNFPIRHGKKTIYYDESFLVDVSFDITIDPSFDREYEISFQLL